MKRRMGTVLVISILLAVLLPSSGPTGAQGGAPAVVSYQGQVTLSGIPYSGTGHFKFAVVNAAGDTTYWSNDGTSSGGGEPTNAVQLAVTIGLFKVLLGDTSLTNMTTLPASAFNGTDRYLRVWFSSDGTTFAQLSPDRRIAAVPYALQAEEAKNAADADLLDGQDSSAFALAGHNHDTTYWMHGGNAFGAVGTLGTNDNYALELKVNNSRALRLEPNATSPNVIGGYSGNSVTAGALGATIGGGGASGNTNRVTDNYGTVGGGYNNRAGDNAGTTSDKTYATVGGGRDNTASNQYTTVGGGYLNVASNIYATVGGGYSHDASGYISTIAGGSDNTASSNYSTVGGGYLNTASGQDAIVGGGIQNTASNNYATVGGGANNNATGYGATVGGGQTNTASNNYATVGGGYNNTAQGTYSFAAGRRAKANHDGAFVWADSTDADFASTGINQFLVRASGGVTLTAGVGQLRLEPNATSPNVIGGYSGNSVTAGAVGATIGGGGASGYTNRVTDDYGTVGGGHNNRAGDNAGTPSDKSSSTVGGGASNTASGQVATVGGGSGNTASGFIATVSGGSGNTASGSIAAVGGGHENTATNGYASVGGGYSNNASGYSSTIGGGNNSAATSDYTTVAGGVENSASYTYATVGGGWNNASSGTASTIGGGQANNASNSYSTVPGGYQASASQYGQMAYASGRFAATGDAQTSTFVMRATTTTNTWQYLWLDGSSTTISIPIGRTIAFDILIVGRSDTGESAAYQIYALIENVTGSTVCIAQSLTVIFEYDSAWDVSVFHDNTPPGGKMVVNVLGNGETIRWVASVRTSEVAW